MFSFNHNMAAEISCSTEWAISFYDFITYILLYIVTIHYYYLQEIYRVEIYEIYKKLPIS
jgi:hypothetical protein